MKQKIRVLGIAPYESLKTLMIQIANERDDIELTVEVGKLQEGAKIAQLYEDENFDAILSRGGTKIEIEKVTSKPVFEIPISYVDLLNVIKLVEHYQGKVAILTYENIAKYAKILCDIFHYDYNISVISESHNGEQMIQKLKKEGYTLIIGDAVSVIYAEKLDIQSMLLISGRESVQQAFDLIANVCEYYSQLKTDTEFFQGFIKAQNEKILVLNENGDLVFSSFEKEKRIFIKFCNSLISSIRMSGSITTHKKIPDGLFIISGNKGFIHGHTFYFFSIRQNKTNVMNLAGMKSITVYNYDDFIGTSQVGLFFFQSFHTDLWKIITNAANFESPVLMIGEAGTEKERLMFQIYLKSKRKYDPLYVVNCTLLTDKDLNFLFNEDNSPLYALHGTVFFKGLEQLSDDLFETLTDELQNMYEGLRSRLSFTYEISGNYDVKKENHRCNLIKNRIGCYEIRIPPLRATPEYISNFSVLYIHQRNRQCEKQIVGIEPEGINMLQEYQWPQNVNQLQRLLDEAMLSSKSPWITAKSIQQLLLSEKQASILCSTEGTKININQPLSGIIYDAAMIVLAEENMNQVKTAKRLKISRTTLWRLLRKNQE